MNFNCLQRAIGSSRCSSADKASWLDFRQAGLGDCGDFGIVGETNSLAVLPSF